MCVDLKKNIRESYPDTKTSEQIQNAADMVINAMGITDVAEGGLPIVEMLKKEGFKVYQDDFDKPTLSAFIAIDPDLQDKFGTNRIICVNERENIGHKRFALAHELAHYLFDFDEMANVTYYNTYRADDEFNSKNFIEKRANTFAACLLMPETSFKKKEREFSSELGKADVISRLSQFYRVSTQAVMRRFKELGIDGYEK